MTSRFRRIRSHSWENCIRQTRGFTKSNAWNGTAGNHVSAIVDSGAINNVTPPDVSAVPVTVSQGSVNGMQQHTADGTRIPNVDQKTLEAVSEQGSALLQVSDRRHIQAADLCWRVCGCW